MSVVIDRSYDMGHEEIKMSNFTDDWATLIVGITLSVSVLAFALAVLVFVVVW